MSALYLWCAGLALFAGATTEAVKRALPSAARLLPLVAMVAGALAALIPWEGVTLDLAQRVGVGALCGSQAAWAYQAVTRALRSKAKAAGLPVSAPTPNPEREES